ncbi:TIGR02391 family protein [Dactylosporangium sp. NPDC050588]|uniref:TIGR02391 family protein n=1 Tax=Dactylosporangium sp. NPDC050588 TaxID=3157211 RepID=UPI0033F82FD2
MIDAAGDEAEATQIPSDGETDGEPTGDDVHPELTEARDRVARVGVLAHEAPSFWKTAGRTPEEPWRWNFTLNRDVRQFRGLVNVGRLLALDAKKWHEIQQMRNRLVHTPATGWEEETTGTGSNDAETSDSEQLALDPLDVLFTALRPEIVEAAGHQLRSGLFDDAIFAAYRRVEHDVQQRTGLKSIGDRLVDDAFKTASNRITISARAQDADRLVEIFGGALGLHKGDRSHKDKPALPCRSRDECFRQLAAASTLLDLLDRGVDQAPAMIGYQQREDRLELSVERAGPGVTVWMDDQPLQIRARTAVTLTVDIAGVPAGLHDLYLVDGTKQGPAVPIVVSRDLGSDNWYRVDEVAIQLFRDDAGTLHPDVQGVRLTGLEDRLPISRIVPTAEQYQVGDYVRWEWDSRVVGEVWTAQPPGTSKYVQLFDASTRFTGSVIGAGQQERTVRLSFEPPLLHLRRGEKAPVRVLRHVSNGIASWTEPLDSVSVVPGDESIVYYKGGVLTAKIDGTTDLRLHHDGLYCSASVSVGAHLRGSTAEVLTALPPIGGIACIGDQLVVSTRQRLISSVKEGKYATLTSVPGRSSDTGRTDTIAAASNGDLAVRMTDHRGVIVLEAVHNYRRSKLVELPGSRAITSMTWTGTTLVVGTDTGEVWRIDSTGDQTHVADLTGFAIALAAAADTLYAIAGPSPRRLLKFDLAMPAEPEQLTEPGTLGDVADVAADGELLYLTDFSAGRVLTFRDSELRGIVNGLANPSSLALAPDGTLYVAEFGRGAVIRVFP